MRSFQTIANRMVAIRIAIALGIITLVGTGLSACSTPGNDQPSVSPTANPGAVNPQIQAAIQSLGDEDETVQEAAFDMLVEIGADAVPALAYALEDDNPQVRWGVAAVLGEIGEEAAPAIPALSYALSNDTDKLVRLTAADSLGSIVPAAATAVPALVGALNSGAEPEVRAYA
ncbi:MAG TPA: HEAT repeat domain-containing protein, partial [Chloroflexi bacterium]|nr:HEAT repeat domain-containing protein [Chloroflexota bacterium]